MGEGGSHGGDTAFHVRCTATEEVLADLGSDEGRCLPVWFRGGDDVYMAAKDERAKASTSGKAGDEIGAVWRYWLVVDLEASVR